ncbi:transposase [Microbulbifer variabilis]|uniref:transposase n=1 Tax=Microbulbifer variabilis TaxID=266805 RepID=UPI001CFCB4C9|nr:transposase [Microbulbifer variabilis]
MLTLFAVLMVFQGKATFLNMERYSLSSEKRYRRWSRRNFDFVKFNAELFMQTFPNDHECVAAIDASFINKSGKKTEGLGCRYYNGSVGVSQRGLEISMISITDLKSNTAYVLDAQQTIDEEGRSRIELYANQAVKLAPTLLDLDIRYLAADAYYTKVKFISAIIPAGLHIVGKLRADANPLWLYEGVYSGTGCPCKHDGKVDFVADSDRFEHVGALDDSTEVYTKAVYASFLKRVIRVVMLRSTNGDKESHALLYSTDTELDAMTLIAYYKSRFQVEFLFRDTK